MVWLSQKIVLIALVVLSLSSYGLERKNGLCILDWSEIRNSPKDDGEFVKTFYRLSTVTPEQIAAWRKETKRPGTPPRLALHIENSILKLLKEKILEDGVTAVSLTSAYKQIFFRKLHDRPEVLRKIMEVGGVTTEYADYKTIRILFSEDSPGLRRKLQKIFDETADEFAQAIPRLVGESTLNKIKRTKWLGKSPELWHMAGFGSSPEHGADEASTAAKIKRYLPGKENETKIIDFNDPKILKFFSDKIDEAEKHRVAIADEFTREFGVNTPLLRRLDTLGGRHILSRRLIGILRQNTARTRTEYLEQIRDRVKKQFRVELNDDQILALQSYYHAIDLILPSIHVSDEITDMGLNRARFGLVAADAVGLGEENLETAMEKAVMAKHIRVKKSPGSAEYVEPGRVMVDYARKGQTDVSNRYEASARELQKSVAAQKIGADTEFSKDGFIISGDDSVFAPDRILDLAEKMDLVTDLARRFAPGSLRVAFGKQARQVEIGHALEKQLKKNLADLNPVQSGVPDILRGTLVAVDVEASAEISDSGTVNLLIAAKDLSPKRIAEIEEQAKAILKKDFPTYRFKAIYTESSPALKTIKQNRGTAG